MIQCYIRSLLLPLTTGLLEWSPFVGRGKRFLIIVLTKVYWEDHLGSMRHLLVPLKNNEPKVLLLPWKSTGPGKPH